MCETYRTQLTGGHTYTWLDRSPSSASVAVTPGSHGAPGLGATPVAHAAYVANLRAYKRPFESQMCSMSTESNAQRFRRECRHHQEYGLTSVTKARSCRTGER